MSEIKREHGKVCICLDRYRGNAIVYLHVLQCSQKNGTWAEDQELAMPVSVIDCIA
jgi:hypothetical protein